MTSFNAERSFIAVLLAVTGISNSACSTRVDASDSIVDIAAWLPDGKADSRTREVTTENFVGYVKGCEATFAAATENDIPIVENRSREAWFASCISNANDWATPLLQDRIDALQDSGITETAVATLANFHAAQQEFCEAHAVLVTGAAEQESFTTSCRTTAELDVSRLIVQSDTAFDATALVGTVLDVRVEEATSVAEVVAQCTESTFGEAGVPSESYPTPEQFAANEACLVELLNAYAGVVAEKLPVDNADTAAEVVGAVYSNAASTWSAVAQAVTMAVGYDYAIANQELNTQTVFDAIYTYQLQRLSWMAAVAGSYNDLLEANTPPTTEASETATNSGSR